MLNLTTKEKSKTQLLGVVIKSLQQHVETLIGVLSTKAALLLPSKMHFMCGAGTHSWLLPCVEGGFGAT